MRLPPWGVCKEKKTSIRANRKGLNESPKMVPNARGLQVPVRKAAPTRAAVSKDAELPATEKHFPGFPLSRGYPLESPGACLESATVSHSGDTGSLSA